MPQTFPWPAPADLSRDGKFACLDFVNSAWTDWRGQDGPTDRLGSPDWWKRFATNWGLGAAGADAPTGRRLAELRKLRAVMRTAIQKHRPPKGSELAWLNSRLATSPNRWTIGGGTDGLTSKLVPSRPGWPAVTAALILSFSQLLNEGETSRLKRCANPDCSYVFYDVSTNQSRRWCFSNECGNLLRVRAFRVRNERKRGRRITSS